MASRIAAGRGIADRVQDSDEVKVDASGWNTHDAFDSPCTQALIASPYCPGPI